MSLHKFLLRRPQIVRPMIAAVTALLISGSNAAQAETWTSLRGTHSVQARLIGIWNGSAVLELDGGRRVSVRLSDLRSESRIQAQELAKVIQQSRIGRVKDLQGDAAAAAAPAPDPLPQPPPARPYTAPQPGADPGQFLSQLDTAVADGHIVAMFDSLPPSYRKDVNEIVRLGAQKIDPNTWRALLGTIHQLGDVIVTRQRWLLSSPRVKSLPPDQLGKIEGPLLSFAGALRDGLNPEAMQLETLQTMEFGQWLAERDAVMAPHLAQLHRQGDAVGRQITVDSVRGASAIVTIAGEGSSKKVTFTQIEGYWVPKTLADGWANSIASHRNEISQTPDGTYLNWAGMLIAPVAPGIQSLAQADDASGFHTAMDAFMTSNEPLVASLAPIFGRDVNLASRGGGRSGYNGDMEGMDDMYDEEMDMEMEMEMEMEDMEGMEDEEMEMEMEMEMEE
jgi:hypothetical protein